MDRLINVLVTVLLVEMMVTVGLGVTLPDLLAVARNPRLVTRALLANYVCVPAATIGLLLLFRPVDPTVSAGFLILAVCPGAPFAPPCTRIAKGDAAVAVGLMAVLAGSSALAAPMLLHILLGLLTDSVTLQVDASRITGTLLVTQVLPLGLGLWLRHWRPALAERLLKPANSICTVLSLLAIGMILYAQFGVLAEIRWRGYAGMLALLVASLGIGGLLGGPGLASRKAMTLTTALRNVGVGLVIATGSFPNSAAITAVVAFGLIQIFGSIMLALIWGLHGAGGTRQRDTRTRCRVGHVGVEDRD